MTSEFEPWPPKEIQPPEKLEPWPGYGVASPGSLEAWPAAAVSDPGRMGPWSAAQGQPSGGLDPWPTKEVPAPFGMTPWEEREQLERYAQTQRTFEPWPAGPTPLDRRVEESRGGRQFKPWDDPVSPEQHLQKSREEQDFGPTHSAPRSLLEGRQHGADVAIKETILSSVLFKIWCPEGSAFFSELGGISSEMEQSEYVESGPLGPMYSRHGGRSRPPTVSLKRAMKTGRETAWLWLWHQMAKKCVPGGLRDPTLLLYGAKDDLSKPARVTYTLVSAFPSKIELSPMKVGGTEVLIQTVTLQCDDIIDINATDVPLPMPV